MSDVQARKIPNENVLRLGIWLGFILCGMGVLQAFNVPAPTVDMHPSRGESSLWWDVVATVLPVTFLIAGGFALAIWLCNIRHKYYFMTVVRVCHEPAEGSAVRLYAEVEHTDHTGTKVTRKIYVGPNRWRTLRTGESMPVSTTLPEAA